MGVNLAPLIFFKYGHFLHELFRPASFGTATTYLLPAGISFYTFQAISYLTDIRRGEISPCRNLLDYSLYHSFFPQLVAGPVERAAHLLPQIREVRVRARYDEMGIRQGLELILLGFFKKMVLADSFALMADPAFGSPGLAGGGYLWVATYAFALQIYFDFSGYIDIGRGSAACLGIRLVENFMAPYRAASLADFWRRWNITIGTWFRDYVYIPLGGSRQGHWRHGMAVMATFALSGLWHGANLTFVGWGFFPAGAGLAGVACLDSGLVHLSYRGGRLDSFSGRIIHLGLADLRKNFHLDSQPPRWSPCPSILRNGKRTSIWWK